MSALLKPLTKQPAESKAVALEFADLAEGALLASIDAATVAPRGRVTAVAPLTIGAQALALDTVRLRLDGGTDGETYLVTVRVTADDGTAFEAEVEIVVVDFTFAAPDGVTPYVSIAQFVARVGLDTAIVLTDATGAGRLDAGRLGAALIDAQALVDGYLAQRFAVPLTTVPQLVTTLVIDLTVARFYPHDVPAGVAAAAAAAARQLRDLADGKLTLPGAATAAATPATAAPLFVDAPGRIFSRPSLRGF